MFEQFYKSIRLSSLILIFDQRHRIEIYSNYRIDNRVNYEELQEELMDRFGEYPDVVAYLFRDWFGSRIWTRSL